MIHVIGIAGKAGCGKTTLAGELCACLPEGWTRFGFADALKTEVAREFGFPLRYCYTLAGKATEVDTPYGRMTVRQLLQHHGTDVVRKTDPDHWVHEMERTFALDLDIWEHGDPRGGLIVDDVRFPNEADWILDQGGHLVYLMPYPGWKPGPHADHESETALDGYHRFSECLMPGFGKIGEAADMIAKTILQGGWKGGMLR
jgi:hypothetical protein